MSHNRTVHSARPREQIFPAPIWGLVAAIGCGACAPPLAPESVDVGEDVHPKTLFDQTLKSPLQSACASCHGMAQGAVSAFLPAGTEYEALVGYKNGLFLTEPAGQSLLLQKGMHAGPPLPQGPFEAARAWIEAETAARARAGKSAVLPTVPLVPGDFNMSFETLAPIQDPGANLTFTLTEGVDRIFRISNLKLTAGAQTGIRLKHPLFYFFSTRGTTLDPADSLARVDMTVASGKTATVGTGGVLLTNVQANIPTRFGLAFESLERADPIMVEQKCKALALFNPAVKDQLQPCAGMCHAPGKNNSAFGAFNMEKAPSQDDKDIAVLCLATLGRVQRSNILIKQITPTAAGGTPNHQFYKINDAAALARFARAVDAWATAEK